ncbi:glycoside hydrolase family 53 protein [Teredinibacter haidensis]|uniref:glycoside hydrolase family 53 protein n=1 Tax=Teredinibacter haidensis TaxID=2731755 RepID=UPI0009FAE271|nr:arabinogalactan endo-1,4-beta-galactosidase [Teredinibacter haidensis]
MLKSQLLFPILGVAAVVSLCNCGGSTSRQSDSITTDIVSTPEPQALQISDLQLPQSGRFYLGADLSYVNEMEDCGAEYRIDNEQKDPFDLFSEVGSNLVRVRLWHNPNWTRYSNLADVTKTIRRAKESGMQVLLDFHYSDTWADPEKQYIPAGWVDLYDDTDALGQALYEYTYTVLAGLQQQNLLPEMVQVGNETNNEILQPQDTMNVESINWPRNAALLNKGLQAVADFNVANETQIDRVLHIAQPENALLWFDQALTAGVTDFDIIGLSYYGKWSTYKVGSVGEAISDLRNTYGKDVMIVETSYPWTLENYDQASNVLGEDSLLAGYPATPQGQLQYIIDLTAQTINAGGLGVIYWEPAWVSTSCNTLWGTGSHWENATFFNAGDNNNALPAIKIYSITQ